MVPILNLANQETRWQFTALSLQTPYLYRSVKPDSKTRMLLFKHHILQ